LKNERVQGPQLVLVLVQVLVLVLVLQVLVLVLVQLHETRQKRPLHLFLEATHHDNASQCNQCSCPHPDIHFVSHHQLVLSGTPLNPSDLTASG
jgi:hypothetical protein